MHTLVKKTIIFAVTDEAWQDMNHREIYQAVIAMGKALDKAERVLRESTPNIVQVDVVEHVESVPYTNPTRQVAAVTKTVGLKVAAVKR